ncbi:MAG: putative Intraflagellar transport protein 46, partial [Streblomastix strix]
GGDENGETEQKDDEEEIMTIFPSIDEFNLLTFTPENRAMVQTVFQFTAHNLSLPTPLRPFLPEYQPAIGDVDNFTKVGRPDGAPELLGLAVLDEPGPEQSNPDVLAIQLRGMQKLTSKPKAPINVRTVDLNEKGALGLDNWIRSIEELHRSQPAPSVTYKGPMPSLETLLQTWPPAFEKSLRELNIPRLSEVDMPFTEYCQMILALLDIPVYEGSVKESLHILFSLYQEFKQNDHFKLISVKDLFPQPFGDDRAK